MGKAETPLTGGWEIFVTTLETITNELLAEGYPSPYQINNGGCDEWANRVLDSFRDDCRMVGCWATDPDLADSSHIFIEIDDRFFDAECPEGVDDYMLLPLFARWQAKHPGGVEPVQREDANEAYDPRGKPTRRGYTAEQLRAAQERDRAILEASRG